MPPLICPPGQTYKEMPTFNVSDFTVIDSDFSVISSKIYQTSGASSGFANIKSLNFDELKIVSTFRFHINGQTSGAVVRECGLGITKSTLSAGSSGDGLAIGAWLYRASAAPQWGRIFMGAGGNEYTSSQILDPAVTYTGNIEITIGPEKGTSLRDVTTRMVITSLGFDHTVVSTDAWSEADTLAKLNLDGYQDFNGGAVYEVTDLSLTGYGFGSACAIPPATVDLTADDYSIPYGGSVELSWTTTESTSRTASGDWSGSKAVSGSEIVGPLYANSSFTLTASNLAGPVSDTVNITVAPPPDPALDFVSNDLFIFQGESIILSWTTENVDTVTASGGWSGSKGTSGSQTIGPLSETTSFTLLAEGPGGSVSTTLTIRVDVDPNLHRIEWYESMFINLLPVGVLWTRINTTFHKVLQSFAVEMVRLHGLGLTLLNESDPRKTTNDLLLSSWERNFLLPDELPIGGETETDRQQVVYAKVVNSGGQSRAFFISLAETLGLTIAITEGSTLEAARVGIARVGTARVNAAGNNLIWNIEFTAEPTTGDIVDKFKSMVDRLKPAHTFVTYT